MEQWAAALRKAGLEHLRREKELAARAAAAGPTPDQQYVEELKTLPSAAEVFKAQAAAKAAKPNRRQRQRNPRRSKPVAATVPAAPEAPADPLANL